MPNMASVSYSGLWPTPPLSSSGKRPPVCVTLPPQAIGQRQHP